MLISRRRFRRNRDGSYRLRLSPPERELLSGLPSQLEPLLGTPEDPDLRRLSPVAYEDVESQAEYESLVGDDLLEGRRHALATIRETAARDQLAPEEAESWLTGLNTLRLVLGTRLDVNEDTVPSLDSSNPRAQEWAVYLYLSWLQDQLVEEMAGAL